MAAAIQVGGVLAYPLTKKLFLCFFNSSLYDDNSFCGDQPSSSCHCFFQTYADNGKCDSDVS